MANKHKYLSKLDRTTILIIGGTSGIGFGLAEACIENDVSYLILVSANQSKVDSAISRLGSTYPANKTAITGYCCDLGDEVTLDSNVQTLFEQIGSKIDHVVFTAGDALTATPLSDVTPLNFKQAGMVRLFAPLIVAKHASKYLNSGPESSITITTGSAGDKPVPGRPAVNVWASASHGLVRSLALELKPVRVNLISLGAVDTELWEKALGPGWREKKMALFESQAKKLATGRVGLVEDVVESYLYVLKDKNVTGSVIRTDGGILLS